MTRTYVVTGSASGIGAATRAALEAQDARVIGIDLRDAEVAADLSTPAGRTRAAEAAIDAADGTVDAVIACAGISAPLPATVAINYFGVVDLLAALRPALARSRAPRAVVTSSMASLHPCAPDLVAACLAGDETTALGIGQGLADQGPQVGYLNYSSSKRAVSRWVRRESITPAWARHRDHPDDRRAAVHPGRRRAGRRLRADAAELPPGAGGRRRPADLAGVRAELALRRADDLLRRRRGRGAPRGRRVVLGGRAGRHRLIAQGPHPSRNATPNPPRG
jgi:NAD(P)-dependent dehydrogenase (short-subunit alcohol dehydrogenase family)